MSRRRLTPLLCLVLLAGLLVPAAQARPLVGIGDQHASVYEDSAMRKIGLRTARLAVAWDWHTDPYTVQRTDEWIAAVTRARMRPLVTFNRNWRPSGRRQIPSVQRYVRSFKLFRKRYPRVREFSPWNEPNALEQPFYNRPALAARYFNAMRRACPRCTVLAGDVKDGSRMVPWLNTYKRKVRGARIWALHNYKDATRRRGGTEDFLRTVRGSVWLTETGGLRNRGGLRGQARAVRRVFSLTREFGRIKRIYFYQWRHDGRRGWDSAFVSRNGTRRPAFYALRAELRRR